MDAEEGKSRRFDEGRLILTQDKIMPRIRSSALLCGAFLFVQSLKIILSIIQRITGNWYLRLGLGVGG